ncbi:hypothetical protein AGMMS50225_18590 [Betaproteobacteria bacterium]|nr:hypothetical protein AGMMS50225_18590 [Betaproteobacteria bacterium]
MKLLRYFLVSILCLIFCGKALAEWHKCQLIDHDAVILEWELLGEHNKEIATLMFLGKVTSQIRWSPVSVEDENGKKPMEGDFYSTTLKVLKVLKGSLLVEEIVISSEKWRGSPGKIYKIYSFDDMDFLDANDCFFFASEISLADDIHGAAK